MQSPEDKAYAEMGQNWTSILEIARSMGFEISEVQFKYTNGNTVSMPFDKLQSARGISLLRLLLSGARAIPKDKICFKCHKPLNAGIPNLEAPWCSDCENS